MFGNSQFDRVRELFSDQFEQNGSGFLYRKGMRAAPIRVSASERDQFVEAFNRRLKFSSWAIFPATVALIFLLVWLAPDVESTAGQVAMWIGLAAILVPFLIVHRWAWNAPSRELQRRNPEGEALTDAELRELRFSKLTYGRLSLAAAMGAGLVWKKSAETDVLHGWGIIWLLLGGLLVAVAGVQAIRKWNYSQR